VKTELLARGSARAGDGPARFVGLVPRAREADSVRDRKESGKLVTIDGPSERAPQGQHAHWAPAGGLAQELDSRTTLLPKVDGRGHSVSFHAVERHPYRPDLLRPGGAGEEFELVAVGRLDQTGDGAGRRLADRHSVAEMRVSVDGGRDDDASNSPLAATPALRAPGPHLHDAPMGEADVGRPGALDIQDGTYDEHGADGGRLSAH